MSHDTHSFCVFQDTQGGTTVQQTTDLLNEYGPSSARLILRTDSDHLAQVIRHAMSEGGAKLYIQIKSATGDGGDPLDNAHVCPPNQGC